MLTLHCDHMLCEVLNNFVTPVERCYGNTYKPFLKILEIRVHVDIFDCYVSILSIRLCSKGFFVSSDPWPQMFTRQGRGSGGILGLFLGTHTGSLAHLGVVCTTLPKLGHDRRWVTSLAKAPISTWHPHEIWLIYVTGLWASTNPLEKVCVCHHWLSWTSSTYSSTSHDLGSTLNHLCRPHQKAMEKNTQSKLDPTTGLCS